MTNASSAKLFVEDVDSEGGEFMDVDTIEVNSATSPNEKTEASSDLVTDQSDNEQSEDDDDDDDEIIESIPLYLNPLTSKNATSIHLLQYLSKSKSLSNNIVHLSAAVKPDSNFIQVKLPLNTEKFYDDSKTDEWGVKVSEHEHISVLNKTNGGLYAAKFVIDKEEKKAILIPIDSTAQLRPSFKYLDDIDNIKNSQRKDVIDTATTKSPQNVHVLQSNVKAVKTSTNDPFANTALGESLKHTQRFDQEKWTPIAWMDDTQQTEEITEIRHNLNTIPENVLETSITMKEYLVNLTK